MTDEINDEGFEPVGPEHADVALPVQDWLLTSKENLKVGELIQTRLDGYYKVVRIDQNGNYVCHKLEEEALGEDHQITFLESYGIQVG